jgi:hypothetical protein
VLVRTRALALALLLSLAAQPALAAGRNPKLRAQAEELMQSGIAALAQGDRAAARAALERAYRLYPAAEILYHLGALALAEGRRTPAQDLMRRYLAEAGEAAPQDLAQEAERVVVLREPPDPAGLPGEVTVLGARGAIVLVDGLVCGALPLSRPLLLSPGAHRVELQLGRQKASGQVQVMPGRAAEMRFELAPAVAVVTHLPAPEAEPERAPVPAPPSPPAPLPKGEGSERPALLPGGERPAPLPGGERTRRPVWRLATGIGLAVAGAGFLGFGIPALAIDGRCVDEPPPGAKVCGSLYETRGLGLGLTVPGAAMLVSGVVLAVWPGTKRKVPVTRTPP